MNLSVKTISDALHKYDARLRSVEDNTLAGVERMRQGVRTNPPSENRAKRAGQALVDNGLWGFSLGVQHCLEINSIVRAPTLTVGARKFFVSSAWAQPVSLYVSSLVVGDHRPVTDDPNATGFGKWAQLQSRGLVSFGTDALNRRANTADRAGRNILAQACRWGVLLLEVPASAARTAIYIAKVPIAIGLGLPLAAIFGTAAFLKEVVGHGTGPVVDFQRLANQMSFA